MSSLLLAVLAVAAPGVAVAQDDFDDDDMGDLDDDDLDDDDEFDLDDDDDVTLDDDDDDGAADTGGGITADAAGGLRVSPYFLLGFGDDLKATVGFGARVDYAVHDYVTVGGVFAWASLKPDIPGLDADRFNVLDFDPYVRGHYVLDVGGKALEAYALLPVGLSIATGNDDTDVGWNIGLLFGATYYVTSSIGVFAELGFMHHGFDGNITQGRLHLGAVFNL